MIKKWCVTYAKAFVNSDVNTIVSMYKFSCEIVHNGKSTIFHHKKNLYHNVDQLCKIYQNIGLHNATYDILSYTKNRIKIYWILYNIDKKAFSGFTCEYYFDDMYKVYLVKNFDEKL